ncbi:protein of unknown function [Nitrospira defluvii]|uniref:Uncharacterized protein n=1 Tax=Nitrospira defluvii TaxID=330214 RepID=D8PAY3_9BACT|nr:protein of unknown function [Nitrospira defluvii]
MPQPDAEKIVQSAKSAIAKILKMGEDVLLEHRRALLSRMIWKITEAHGKYTTRYCSGAARNDGGKLRHEHVTPRKVLIDRLLNNPSGVERILQDAIACTVTAEEHSRLSGVREELCGWDRYSRAKIEVIDRAKGK